jgi:DNA-binding transcriptional MerR regulator
MRLEEQPRTLRSGRLAHLAGVSTDTLRHYERKGLLASRRSPNGYREYPPEALNRVRLVQRALSVGFSLDELARLLRIRHEGGAPCREVRALAAAKLESMEVQIRELKALRSELRDWIAAWDVKLAQTPRGKRAWLLESWARDASEPRKLHPARMRPKRQRGTGRRSGRIEKGRASV